MGKPTELRKRCPRCGSKNTGSKYINFSTGRGKKAFCKDCELVIANKSIDYVNWRWNRDKEKQAEYIIPLVNKEPDNIAFCGNDLVKIWGSEEALCEFVSEKSGRKVISYPSFINPEGVLLKGV